MSFRAELKGVPFLISLSTLLSKASAFFLRSANSSASRRCAEQSWMVVLISFEDVYLKETLHWWQKNGGGRGVAVTPVQMIAEWDRSSHFVHLITWMEESLVFGWHVVITERWLGFQGRGSSSASTSRCSAEPPIGSSLIPFFFFPFLCVSAVSDYKVWYYSVFSMRFLSNYRCCSNLCKQLSLFWITSQSMIFIINV